MLPVLSAYISRVILHIETLYLMLNMFPGLSAYISSVVLHIETLYVLLNMLPGLSTYISGVVLHIVTLYQQDADAYKRGACFAKWRDVLQIGPAQGLPPDLAVVVCVRSLARYAATCQRQRLVRIVELVIVSNEKIFLARFAVLALHKVYLKGAVLKPNMVKDGIGDPKATIDEVSALTVTALNRIVPAMIPGIFVLLGETALDEDIEEATTISLDQEQALPILSWHFSFPMRKVWDWTVAAHASFWNYYQFSAQCKEFGAMN